MFEPRTLPIKVSFVKNSTHTQCLERAYSSLKGLSFFDRWYEEKLDQIQRNLECALEEYGEKIKKRPGEDPIALIERTTQLLITFGTFFSNNVKAIIKLIEKYPNPEQHTTNTRRSFNNT